MGVSVYFILLVALGWSFVADAQAGSAADRIVYYAKLTAQAKNSGDDEKAEEALLATQETFEEAVRADPEDPQPHMHMGVFYTNIHRFKESIEQLNIALKKLGHYNPQGSQQIKTQIRKAKLGMYSTKRDKAYDEGRGNITKARLWAQMQLKVSPTPEKIYHDLGTLEMMLCERNSSYCEMGQVNLREAHNRACQNFAQGFAQHRAQGHQETSGDINPCRKLKCLLGGSWNDHEDLVTVDVLADHHEEYHSLKKSHGSIYLHTTDDIVSTLGQDGVLQIANSPDCSLLLPTSDYYMNLHDNIIAPNQQQGRKPFVDTGAVDTQKPVLSLAQFSGATFYHWLVESLPRLVVAMQHWPLFNEAAIIVPSRGSKIPGFITSTLTLILGETNVEKKNILPYNPTFSFPYGAAFVAWSPQPCPISEEETEEPKVGCAGLPHPAALHMARSAIHAGLDRVKQEQMKKLEEQGKVISSSQPEPEPYIVVALRGRDVSMRMYDEKALTDTIVSLVTNYLPPSGSTYSGYGIKLFEAENHTFTEAMQIFRGASVVIGLHGGALSNIIACRGDRRTALLEIGFRTAAARHYQHMANSLEMHYRLVPVDDDDLHRALGAPLVTFDSTRVQKVLLELLAVLDGKH